MRSEPIEYFYSVRSSFTYLGAARLNALANELGVTVVHYPVDLGKLVERLEPIEGANTADRAYAGARVRERCPVRERYAQLEYRRWSRYLGIPINVDPKHHYGPRELPSGVVIAAQRRGLDVGTVSHAVLQALWRDDLDIADEKLVAGLLDELRLGVPGAALCAEAVSSSVQEEFAANTALAAAKGVFGSPTYIYRGEPFFGQDHLGFLRRAIRGDGAGTGSGPDPGDAE
ncbi:2-hydroxychromene-2-carboxylate isomerase [Marinimicrococcus flavescens]|uniref:2-hydroxychromene-2-carboxylate isomerase n=1 Tax=Marinimicrococcus flavescens TaxID=3031815 RepID=A0AAP3UY66_9PROT|nr:2-hydroxychromene-2-carboxylate isomerase [Marinimicrococcus flavescens]